VAGALFLVALLFSPLVGVVGRYPPVTAPALVVVGAMMMRQAARIDWDDATEALPAFLTIAGIPLTYSIADGLAIGFTCYPVVKILAGRWRDLRWLNVILAVLLVLYFLFVRVGLG
jgi:AGZA family xanthine/uracil permease-like MFS transporter